MLISASLLMSGLHGPVWSKGRLCLARPESLRNRDGKSKYSYSLQSKVLLLSFESTFENLLLLRLPLKYSFPRKNFTGFLLPCFLSPGQAPASRPGMPIPPFHLWLWPRPRRASEQSKATTTRPDQAGRNFSSCSARSRQARLRYAAEGGKKYLKKKDLTKE